MNQETRETVDDLRRLVLDARGDIECSIDEGFDLDEGRAGKTKAEEITDDYLELLASLPERERAEVERELGADMALLHSLAEGLPGIP
jgi:hypothetical protein